MHELSIAQALLEQVGRAAEEHRAPRVTSVTVAVGALSGVEPAALELAFPLAAEDTPARGARLVIESVPARVRCRACGRACRPEFPFLACEHCGSTEVDIASGRELTLKSIEVASD